MTIRRAGVFAIAREGGRMGSIGEDEAARTPPDARPKPDRRAEALRSNLLRRKAQTRARREARPQDPEPDATGRDG